MLKHVATLWLGLAVVAAAVIYALIGVRHVQAHQNDALRSIICRVDYAQQRSSVLSEKQKLAAGLFWREALDKANLRPCFPPK